MASSGDSQLEKGEDELLPRTAKPTDLRKRPVERVVSVDDEAMRFSGVSSAALSRQGEGNKSCGKIGFSGRPVKAVWELVLDAVRLTERSWWDFQNLLPSAARWALRAGAVGSFIDALFRRRNLVKTSRGRRLPTPDQLQIRWMIRRDMAEILCIEEESFEFPWADADFTRCLRQRNCIGMVAEMGGSVVGFMLYELHRAKVHVLNFAVARSHRRFGIGTGMMTKLIAKLTPQRRDRIMLEVRETNLPAQLFFRSLGFRATTVLRDFYQDSTEDAYLMQFLALPDASELPRRLAG